MTAVVPHAAAADLVRQLPKTLKNYADFDRTIEALAAGQPASIDGVWGSACALVAAALAESAPGPLVVVLPTQREADDAELRRIDCALAFANNIDRTANTQSANR